MNGTSFQAVLSPLLSFCAERCYGEKKAAQEQKDGFETLLRLLRPKLSIPWLSLPCRVVPVLSIQGAKNLRFLVRVLVKVKAEEGLSFPIIFGTHEEWECHSAIDTRYRSLCLSRDIMRDR